MEAKAGVRARREGWAKGVKVELTERDLDILALLGVCGVMRTRDVVRMFFGTRATANDRLRKLYCAGVIECFAPSLTSDNYYALTSRGQAVLSGSS